MIWRYGPWPADGMHFPMLFGAVFWLFLVVLLFLVLPRGWFGGSSRRHSPGLDVLEERYARGEIDRDEYLQKKKDLAD